MDVGGWPNPDIIEWYLDYARICFTLFGDSVKYWVTFNEPKNICHQGYGSGEKAPLFHSAQAEYLCTHHVLLAHTKTWELYEKTYKKTQKGKHDNIITA